MGFCHNFSAYLNLNYLFPSWKMLVKIFRAFKSFSLKHLNTENARYGKKIESSDDENPQSFRIFNREPSYNAATKRQLHNMNIVIRFYFPATTYQHF